MPDHSTIARFLEKIPEEWLEQVLAKTANACMDAACVSDGTLAAGSTGVETDRYWMTAKPDKNRHKFTYVRTKRYVKWHTTALLGLQVILSCRITSSNIHDTVVLRTMLNSVEDLGRSFAGWRFNADKGYDSDGNCEGIFAMGMTPNIKQKVNARSRGKEFRAKAARIFDHATYKKRGMIEGIFGANEAEHHQLYCRFRKNASQRGFGLLKTIGWNIEILNRRVHCGIRICDILRLRLIYATTPRDTTQINTHEVGQEIVRSRDVALLELFMHDMRTRYT